ncbi:MAG: gspD 1 [Phycisphaerales bacterium]|nr:gspD 1 [Phycisphaerales bacterium]MDB5357315.1 gspD 1 [Phycisphaerales bacterium]
MQRSRSRSAVLALALAAACPSPIVVRGVPATAPADPATRPAGASSLLPAATQPAATQPAEAQAAKIRLNFHDTPIDAILEHLSRVAGFVVVREAPVTGNVTVLSMQPVTPAETVAMLDAVLRGNGLAVLQTGRTLRIVAREKAKKGNVPVHFGADPAAVESSEELITQVIPLHNVDAVKLRTDLVPLIGPEADVTANAGANAMVMTDSSANVKRIVEIISILDKREGTTSEVKIIPLKNASAPAAARLVLSIFHVDEPRPAPNQPLPPQHEGRLLGTGVDQALHGGKVTAGADERTNSVVVAAPAETLKAIEAMLKEIDENPATAATPGIKSFHLKLSDARAVARALTAVFTPEAGAGEKSYQATTTEALHARVTIVPEERTNTLIITAPPAAMVIVESLVKDLEGNPATESTVQSFRLEYADAAATAKVLMSVFLDPATGQSRLKSGARETLSVTADPRTNTIIVTASADEMRALVDAIKMLDASPTSGGAVKVFHLKQADSEATAKFILNFFKPDGVGPARPADAVHVGVNAVADPRTNTVAVTAPQESMKVVEGLIKDMEGAAAVEPTVRTFHLNYADAATTAKALNSVFLDPATGQARIKAGSRDTVSATFDLRTNSVMVTTSLETMHLVEQTIKELDASPTSSGAVKFFHLKQADADTTAKLILNFFKPPEGATTPQRPPDSVHVGVNAVADTRTNTVAVTAPDESMKLVEQIIHEMETDPSAAFDIESFSLKFADATATAKLLASLFQPDPSQAASGTKGTGREAAIKAKVVTAADDRTNTVVVTAPADTLKIIETVVKMLDANPVSGAEIQVFQLVNADASTAAKLLQSTFQPAVLQSSSAAPTKPPGTVDAIRRLGWVSATSDDRTNTLIVTAPAEVMRVVTGIVRQLDSNPVSQQAFFIYRLRNGQAQNLELVLNNLFGSGQSGASSATARPAQGLTAQGQAPAGRGPGLTPSGGTGIGARRGTSGFLATGAAPVPQLSPGTARAVTEMSGQVYVVADPDTNSLLVTTATRYQSQVRAIITELDRPVPQVLIKVLVAEVSHDDSADWGLDFSVLNRRNSGNGQSGSTVLGNAAAGAANGGLVVSMLETNVNATLHALATAGKLDVLSRPYILASDNQLASITVGQEVPFITDTRLTDTGQTINTIQYQDVGIILNVTPHINPEGLVILDVAPEISQLADTTVTITTGVAAPVINKRSAQSRVGIINGQTIVIGGLMEDRKTTTVNKVPILGDIPWIGELFRRTQAAKSKTELLIFLTPHVAQQPETLKPMSDDEMRGTKLTPHAVEPGTFEEQMRGMHRGDVPETRPAAPATQPVIEMGAATTQPSDAAGPTTIGPIRLP